MALGRRHQERTLHVVSLDVVSLLDRGRQPTARWIQGYIRCSFLVSVLISPLFFRLGAPYLGLPHPLASSFSYIHHNACFLFMCF
jgi:hypothetical protein